jgi:hypothetical protein
MIRWIVIVVLSVACTVMGYREIERFYGDGNVTLTDIRTAVKELRETQEENEREINGNAALILNNNNGLKQIYGKCLDLNRRLTVLENIAPAHPPVEDVE